MNPSKSLLATAADQETKATIVNGFSSYSKGFNGFNGSTKNGLGKGSITSNGFSYDHIGSMSVDGSESVAASTNSVFNKDLVFQTREKTLNKSSSFVDKYLSEKKSGASARKNFSGPGLEPETSKTKKSRDVAEWSETSTSSLTSITSSSLSSKPNEPSVRRKVFDPESKPRLQDPRPEPESPVGPVDKTSAEKRARIKNRVEADFDHEQLLQQSVRSKAATTTSKQTSSSATTISSSTTMTSSSGTTSRTPAATFTSSESSVKASTTSLSSETSFKGTSSSSTSSSAATTSAFKTTSSFVDEYSRERRNPLRHSRSVGGGWLSSASSCRHEEGSVAHYIRLESSSLVPRGRAFSNNPRAS